MSREVLAPPILRMDNNRCYRVNLVHEDFGNQLAAMQRQRHQQQPIKSANAYMEQDLYAEDDDDDETETGGSFTLEELPNSTYKLTMHVAQGFYGGLIGFKGSTKRRIESETQTDIYVPRNREGAQKQAEDVSVKGKTRSSVMAARRKINLLILSLRKRMRPTHFLCAPLNYGDIKESFIEFKKQILAAELPGIDERLFQTEGCIHLTLVTCILLDDAERAKAVEILQSCREFLTKLRTPFQIKISGLEIMNDDPSAVRVLYACVEAPELQQFADAALQPFLRSGLSFEEYERQTVKLHMTVMNNRWRKMMDPQASDSFDAREIFKRYGDYNFGQAECSEVHLCVMRVPGDEREFYKITGTMKF